MRMLDVFEGNAHGPESNALPDGKGSGRPAPKERKLESTGYWADVGANSSHDNTTKSPNSCVFSDNVGRISGSCKALALPVREPHVYEPEGFHMSRSTTAGAMMLLATFGCQSGGATETTSDEMSSPRETKSVGELHVEVFYRERMLLPPTAILEVVLEDVAKMDVEAELIAKKTTPLNSAAPYRVTLEYAPSKLQDRGRYGVRARIENDGRLMFSSTQFNPAFGADGSHDSPPNDPVQVLVRRVAGRGVARASSITGTRWVLQKLRGEPAGLGAGGQAPHITLQGAEPRVFGFAGCNQISGGYTLDGDQLSFGQMAMTMRACPEGMDLERDFAKALRETQRYEITEDALRLRDEHGTVVAELKAGSS